ncbi:hypothetical protein NC651_011830 [Populus alba x Populus x berolinensis]|nr:hypothetical protein NC651_011830 [Populus alba x Populus x berolinensis]
MPICCLYLHLHLHLIAFVLFLTPQTKSTSVDTVCGTISYGNS